jgi:hypothetical protein
MLHIKNSGTGVVTVNRAGADTIEFMTTGATTFALLPGEAVGLHAYAAATWLVF